MKVKYLGQNCFLFSYNGINILSDPFYNYQKAQSGFDITAQQIHVVLITHAHGDHTADVKEVLENHPNAVLIAQPEICSYFKHSHCIDLNYGGTAEVAGLEISMVPALHTSSFPDGSYGGQPCGYMMGYSSKKIYLAGDTGVMADMRLFPELYGALDLSILPIGGHYTMDARNAAFAASELLKCSKVMGCHFDTFPPIAIDHKAAAACFDEKGVELVLPEPGAEYEV